jgi:hypothetical protein
MDGDELPNSDVEKEFLEQERKDRVQSELEALRRSLQ